jgi:translation initiation factor 2 subunit 2
MADCLAVEKEDLVQVVPKKKTEIQQYDDIDLGDLDIDYTKKKKKKSKESKGSKAVEVSAPVMSEEITSPPKAFESPAPLEPELSYDHMLEALYEQLYKDRPHLATGLAAKRIKPPVLARVGTKKTCWTNFSEYEVSLNRPSEHLLSFVLAELGTTGSIDGSNQLILKTRMLTKNAENLLRKYIDEYVKCGSCKGLQTDLVRDPATKIHFITCKSCLASRSSTVIKAGYHATTKADRKAAREEG